MPEHVIELEDGIRIDRPILCGPHKSDLWFRADVTADRTVLVVGCDAVAHSSCFVMQPDPVRAAEQKMRERCKAAVRTVITGSDRTLTRIDAAIDAPVEVSEYERGAEAMRANAARFAQDSTVPLTRDRLLSWVALIPGVAEPPR